MSRRARHRVEPEPVERVRWRKGRRWVYGHLNGHRVEDDGSLRVYDDHNGGARSLPLDTLQHETHGTRGGRHWAWITPHPESDAQDEAGHRLWRPPEGPAELFNQHTLWDDQP